MPGERVFKLLAAQLVKWFVGAVWPWIVAYIWPELKQLIIEIFTEVVSTLRERLSEWFADHNRARAERAQKRAEEAEARAKAASSDAEAEKQRAIAEVWRQVAEEFRQENDTLRAKLDEFVGRSESDFRDAVNGLDVENLVEEGEDASLRLKGSDTVLALPLPAAKKD